MQYIAYHSKMLMWCDFLTYLLTENEYNESHQTSIFRQIRTSLRLEACLHRDRVTLYKVYKKKGNRTSARYYMWITRRMNNWFSYSERSGL
jgi:hypothetical protein